MIYLFKGRNGEIISTNEMGAHNELRNKGQWQRQDLVYLGACDEKPMGEALRRYKEEAVTEVISSTNRMQSLLKGLELARLEGNEKEINRKQLEISVLDNEMREMIKQGQKAYVSQDVDELLIKINSKINAKEKELMDGLVPDPKLFPRNFNSVTSNFGGELSNVAPADFLSPPNN